MQIRHESLVNRWSCEQWKLFPIHGMQSAASCFLMRLPSRNRAEGKSVRMPEGEEVFGTFLTGPCGLQKFIASMVSADTYGRPMDFAIAAG